MKTTLFLILCVVVTLLASCAAPKRTVATQEREVIDIAASMSRETSLCQDIIIRQELSSVDSIVIERYSPPDSTGKQYLTERAVATKKTNSSSTKQEKTEQETVELRDSLAATVCEAESKEKTEPAIPWWVKTLAYAGALAIVVLIARILIKIYVRK